MADIIRVMIETDREGAAAILAAPERELAVEGSGPPPAPSSQGLAGAHMLEPISLAVAIASIAGLASRILEHWLRNREHGVQIDARTQPATLSTIAGVPNGFVVMIAADGSVQSLNASAVDAGQFAGMLTGLFKTAGQRS